MKPYAIVDLLAGRKIDALIAEHIMGWAWATIGEEKVLCGKTFTDEHGVQWLPTYWPAVQSNGFSGGGKIYLPCYSTDLVAAFDVVKEMADNIKFSKFTLIRRVVRYPQKQEDEWYAEFGDPEKKSDFVSTFADSAPLAICRAALLAINYQREIK